MAFEHGNGGQRAGPVSGARRVLFVTYDFPPRRTSAVYRHVGLNKYLEGFGWQPTILTADLRPGETEDPTLLEGLPAAIRIERTRNWSVAAWEGQAAKGIRTVGGLQTPSESAHQSFLDRQLRGWGDFLRSCLYFPDDTVGWMLPGLARALELHFAQRFNLVYTSSPARSAPLIGWALKQLTGVPWIAEFRDPWYPHKRPWRRRFERWLHARLLKDADGIVVISEGHAHELRRSFGVPAQKISIVSNGYDETDFADLRASGEPLFPKGFVHVSHFGTVYPGFCGSFFSALSELLKEEPGYRQRLRVHVVGFPDDPIVRTAASQEPMRDVVQIHGFMPHHQALRAMQASDCLLLFLADPQVSRLSGLGKIYWYLRAGRPILAITPEGGTRDLVEQGRAGWAVHPEDGATMKAVLRALLQSSPDGSGGHVASPEFATQFRYDHLAGRLAAVLNSVARTP